jgi:hypothetical protein
MGRSRPFRLLRRKACSTSTWLGDASKYHLFVSDKISPSRLHHTGVRLTIPRTWLERCHGFAQPPWLPARGADICRGRYAQVQPFLFFFDRRGRLQSPLGDMRKPLRAGLDL